MPDLTPPDTLKRRFRSWNGPASDPPVGSVDFGDLRRLTPVSAQWGYDRGRPVDRYYIETFLERHAEDVRGRVLEIGDSAYTQRFGATRVTASEVLNLRTDVPGTTLVADLTHAPEVDADTFDCIILTQTLQLVYELRAAVTTLHRLLKPGGCLLATVPGISQIDQGEWRDAWCWSFTATSLTRLFLETFQAADLLVETHGNVLAAVAFLHGLSDAELEPNELDYRDPHYQLVIAMRARKNGPAEERA